MNPSLTPLIRLLSNLPLDTDRKFMWHVFSFDSIDCVELDSILPDKVLGFLWISDQGDVPGGKDWKTL